MKYYWHRYGFPWLVAALVFSLWIGTAHAKDCNPAVIYGNSIMLSASHGEPLTQAINQGPVVGAQVPDSYLSPRSKFQITKFVYSFYNGLPLTERYSNFMQVNGSIRQQCEAGAF